MQHPASSERSSASPICRLRPDLKAGIFSSAEEVAGAFARGTEHKGDSQTVGLASGDALVATTNAAIARDILIFGLFRGWAGNVARSEGDPWELIEPQRAELSGPANRRFCIGHKASLEDPESRWPHLYQKTDRLTTG